MRQILVEGIGANVIGEIARILGLETGFEHAILDMRHLDHAVALVATLARGPQQHDLDADVIRRQAVVVRLDAHLQAFAKASLEFLAGLVQPLEPHLLPGLAHAGLPLRQRPGATEAIARQQLAMARGRHIEALGVLGHHPVRVEMRDAGNHRPLGDMNPFVREAALVAVVVGRDHLVLQHVIERGRVIGIAHVRVGMLALAADGPAVVALVALRPPAIEDAQVRHAVHRRLHAGGARGLQRPDGIVQPHVHAGGHVAGQRHVVALQHQHLADEFRPPRIFMDAPDELLPRLIGRVRLAGEQEHHRPIRTLQNLAQPRLVVEQQRGALVGGEAARKAHHQRSHVEQRRHPSHQVRALAIAARLMLQQLTHVLQHALLVGLMDAPVVMIGDILHALPEIRLQQLPPPLAAQMLVEGVDPLRGQPRGHVHAVGHRGDGILLRLQVGPHGLAHAG